MLQLEQQQQLIAEGEVSMHYRGAIGEAIDAARTLIAAALTL